MNGNSSKMLQRTRVVGSTSAAIQLQRGAAREAAAVDAVEALSETGGASCIEVEIFENVVDTRTPIPETTGMTAAASSEATSPYSTVVAPVSSVSIRWNVSRMDILSNLHAPFERPPLSICLI